MKIHRLKKKRDFCWPTRGEISEPPGQLRQRPCRQRAYVAFSHTLPGVENRLNTVCAASKVLQSSLFSRPGCLMRPWLRSWRRPPQQLIFDFKTSKPQINISIVDFFTILWGRRGDRGPPVLRKTRKQCTASSPASPCARLTPLTLTGRLSAHQQR